MAVMALILSYFHFGFSCFTFKCEMKRVSPYLFRIELNIRIEQNIYFVDADQFRQEVGCWWHLESWY